MAVFTPITKNIGQAGYTDQVRNALNQLSLLGDTGLVWKGGFTPVGGTEYPATPSFGWSYTISGLTGSYTFTTGDLIGLVVFNGMTIAFSTVWMAGSYDSITRGDLNLAISNLSQPVVDIDTSNSLHAKKVINGVNYGREQEANNQGTAVDSRGVLNYYNADIPRKGQYGMPLEPEATNLLTYSSTLATNWVSTRASISTDGTLSSDGVTNMIKITEDSTVSSTHLLTHDIAWTVNTWTAHIDFKAGSANRGLRLLFGDGAFPTNAHIDIDENYNITTGVGAVSASIIKVLNNGGVRIAVTATADTAINANMSIVMLDTLNTTTTISGDGTSFIYAAFPQIELGSIATSYIPTTTAPVTRGRDVMNIDPINFPKITSGVTIHQKWYIPNITELTHKTLISIGNNDASIAIYMQEGNKIVGRSGGAIYSIYLLPTIGVYDIKFVMDETHNYLYVNGILAESDDKLLANILPSSPTEVNIGYWLDVDSREANAEHILTRIYDRALTPQEARL